MFESRFFVVISIMGVLEIAVICALSWVIFKIRRIDVKSEVFFEGKNGKSLEELILKNSQELKLLDKEIQELYDISNKINALAAKSIHKVNVNRFNPFKDIGGNQSFSLALLNGKNTGLVLTSLHTREGTRVYIKPVVKGSEERFPFTAEEEKAIKEAGMDNDK